MGEGYLDEIDALPPAEKWPRARHFIFCEPMPFYAELRARRPVLVLPEVTLATRFDDCSLISRRHEIFGVDLYKPKQGQYFMAQDDTAAHWREKSVMRALLEWRNTSPCSSASAFSPTSFVSAEWTPCRVSSDCRGAAPSSLH
jgi:hypothetical protein